MDVITALQRIFSASLTVPLREIAPQSPLTEEQTGQKVMYAVITIVDSFRIVLQPLLKSCRICELPGPAYDGVRLQDSMHRQTGWTNTVILPGRTRGRLCVTQTREGAFEILLKRRLPDLLNTVWIHFLAAYNTHAGETPLLCAAAALRAPDTCEEAEAGLCLPLRIIPADGWDEIRLNIAFSSNFIAFLLTLDLPDQSPLGSPFRPVKATLQEGKKWVANGFCREKAKYFIWPGEVVAGTQIFALSYGISREEN